MATLLESLKSLVAPATAQIADRLGEPAAVVSSGLPSVFASVLGGLVSKANNQTAFRPIFDLITSRPPGTELPVDAQSVLGAFVAGGAAAATGTKFLNMAFAGHTNAVANLLTRTLGFQKETSGATLLSLAGPLVLGALGKRVRDDGLDSSGLGNLLTRERDDIFDAMPAGVSSLISSAGQGVPQLETPVWNRAATTARQYADTSAADRRPWVWPIVGLATLGLVWFALSHRNIRAPHGAAVVDTTISRGGGVVGSAGGEVSSGLGSLGAFTKRALPNGVELDIPANGIESELITFIEEPSRTVDKNTWFEFDRLNFATGSAKLLPGSQEQIGNMVAILKAYPAVKVKIGGYTDNVGAPAANLRLSQERADAVKQAIVHDGVGANRIVAEGYGEQHPVADNTTEGGRAQNRRIALRVTAK
ncbi:MAG TPA: OmpA family protein [Gemmatimonadaceae bacterium]|jgi:outer membrane protein OmpA-like peptidoglycan-associated protein|nr:OmpA family protein [Gemmatimonadaceae bacterium]